MCWSRAPRAVPCSVGCPELIAQKHLHKEGKGRSTRYRRAAAVEDSTTTGVGITASGYGEPLIPLSTAAKAVGAHVRQPLQRRMPVGYDSAFLDSYRPNTTFYLPESIRMELLACGQAVNVDAPAGTYARQIANRLLIDPLARQTSAFMPGKDSAGREAALHSCLYE